MICSYDPLTDRYFDTDRGAVGGWVNAEWIAARGETAMLRMSGDSLNKHVRSVGAKVRSVPEDPPGLQLQFYLQLTTARYLDMVTGLGPNDDRKILEELRSCE